jgi:hypothetical protein
MSARRLVEQGEEVTLSLAFRPPVGPAWKLRWIDELQACTDLTSRSH